MPKRVVAVKTKLRNPRSAYWLVLEKDPDLTEHPEVPCTFHEFWAAKKALNSGGIHVVNAKQ